jgi:hypothetical protein
MIISISISLLPLVPVTPDHWPHSAQQHGSSTEYTIIQPDQQRRRPPSHGLLDHGTHLPSHIIPRPHM